MSALRILPLILAFLACLIAQHALARSGDTLVILFLNGLTGSEKDSQLLRDTIRTRATNLGPRFDGQLILIASRANTHKATADAIAVKGERLLKEIRERFRKEVVDQLHLDDGKPHRIFISMVGHSYGGIMARYAAGHLFERDFAMLREGLGEHKHDVEFIPLSYMSVSSPHLGVEPGMGVMERMVSRALLSTFSSGRDLQQKQGGWLETLTAPNGIYYEAWSQFQSRTLVGAIDDELVRPRTSCVFNSNVRKDLWAEVGKRGDRSSFHVLWTAGFERFGSTALDAATMDRYSQELRATQRGIGSQHIGHDYDSFALPPQVIPHNDASTSQGNHSLIHDYQDFYDGLLVHINEIGVRRILLDLGCSGFLSGMAITHPLMIGKDPTRKGIHRVTAEQTTELYARLLLLDYQVAERRMRL